jgi:GNAT superfamily N-acetyltransferase
VSTSEYRPFRIATKDDLIPLAELERAANLVGLAHLFPPDQYPFPFDDVLARWRLVLDDPTAVVLVTDQAHATGKDPRGDALVAYVAYDDDTLRHIAVHPEHWGHGVATAGVGVALRGMAQRGREHAWLWVLQENHRARRLYEHLGWQPTDEHREAPWPPHPREIRYHQRLPAPDPE